MDHIGIDLGGRKSQVCVRNSAGDILAEGPQATTGLGAYLKTRPPSRVVLESCAEAFAVAAEANAAGHEVRIIPATVVRTLGVGARGIKTDRRDARVQSEVSCRIDLPSIHIPSIGSRELKSVLNTRDLLLASRTQLINGVRGYLRGHLLQLQATPENFPQRARKKLLASPVGVPAHIERLLLVLESLNAQIDAADADLEQQVESHPVCRLLRTGPCVGPVTAARFVSTLDDPKRFASAKAVASYLGLSPGESSSSSRKHRTGITKAGSAALRRCLVQVSWSIWRTRPHEPLRQWGAALNDRHGKQTAVTAMARKLGGILWAMWRDGRAYEPREATRGR
jgi:transposase